jgi:hypothetical protein
MNNKINFSVVVFLFFTFPVLFGQNNINYCEVLEEILTNSRLPRFYGFELYDTIYIHERDTIKYFTNCDFSHIETDRIVIAPNNIPLKYDTVHGGEVMVHYNLKSLFDVRCHTAHILYDTIYGKAIKIFPDIDSLLDTDTDFSDFDIRRREIVLIQDTSFFGDVINYQIKLFPYIPVL